MEVTCETMAVMAATLANGGICPLTDKQVLRNGSVRDTLSLMYSCGLDEYSGEFAFKVSIFCCMDLLIRRRSVALTSLAAYFSHHIKKRKRVRDDGSN